MGQVHSDESPKKGWKEKVAKDAEDLTLKITGEERIASLKDKLLNKGLVNTGRDKQRIKYRDNRLMNKMIVFTWPFFGLYLCLQPLLSNWLNNMWFEYTALYTVYNRNASVQGEYKRPGMCDTDASLMVCSDGQNFTALAMKYRGKPVGCGCGQGVLGEGLCPMTSYGYTLSDYVSTEPGIAAMLGLGFFPLLGTWRNTVSIDILAKPNRFWQKIHVGTMLFFQVSYIAWGICSDCIFPNLHSILTVFFLGGFFVHWVVTANICVWCMGLGNIESLVTMYVACASLTIMTVGAIPRVFLTLNDVLGTTFFPNLNHGIGSYAFWAAEAGGLTLTFGAYPIVLLAVYFFPARADMNKDGKASVREQQLFALWGTLDKSGTLTST